MPACCPPTLMRNAVKSLTAALVCSWIALPAAIAQKQGQKTETKQGTIVEIKQSGRRQALVIEVDGKQQTVAVTPKLNLQIKAAGDAGFLREGQYLSATAVMSNDKLFIKELTISPVKKGQRVPPGKIVKAEAEAGQSKSAYDVSGLITAMQPNADYPEHRDVVLKATGVRAPIMIEPEYSVTVSSSDPALIPADAEAELEVAPLRGGRFKVVGVTIDLPEALNSAEFFGDKPEPDSKQPIASP